MPVEGVLVPRVSQPLVRQISKTRNPLLAHVPGQRDPDRHLRKATADLDVRGTVDVCHPGLTSSSPIQGRAWPHGPGAGLTSAARSRRGMVARARDICGMTLLGEPSLNANDA